MRKWYHHPMIVWPVLFLICIPLFVWSWVTEQKQALRFAWFDTFGSAIDHARCITRQPHSGENSGGRE